MHDFELVQRFEPFDHLDEYFPDRAFVKIRAAFLVLGYFLKEVAVVRVLHHQAE